LPSDAKATAAEGIKEGGKEIAERKDDDNDDELELYKVAGRGAS
jgi:hypothetical protein